MWVHSLWSLVPGEVGELGQHLSGALKDPEQQKLPGGILLRQWGWFRELPPDDPWVQTSSTEATELSGLYVLAPEEYGLQSAGGRSLVGAVSLRPASNHRLVESALAVLSRQVEHQPENVLTLLPVLSKDILLHLDGLSLYEARTEREDREVSVTYLDPESPGLLNEWPDDATEFAAATFNWQNHLLTVFADGQVWLEGVTPDQVPSAIGVVSVNMWGRTPVDAMV